MEEHQSIIFRRKRTVFSKQNPLANDWDDGCDRTKLNDFVTIMVKNYCTRANVSVPPEFYDAIWYAFSKTESFVTPYNRCRVMAICITVVIKWWDDDQRPLSFYHKCLPSALYTSLTLDKFCVLEYFVFFKLDRPFQLK
jgi:hypothetical protein